MRVTPFVDPKARLIAGMFGMKLFLVSLGMLFAASLVGYFVIRFQTRLPPEGVPPLPRILWMSTSALILSSVTMQWALMAVRENHLILMRTMMLFTTFLGIAFLV